MNKHLADAVIAIEKAKAEDAIESVDLQKWITDGESMLESYSGSIIRGYADTAGGCLYQAIQNVKREGLDAPYMANWVNPEDAANEAGWEEKPEEAKKALFDVYAQMLRDGCFGIEILDAVEVATRAN